MRIFTWWRADRLALTGTLILTAGLLAGFRTQARPDYLANQITFGTIHAPGSTFAWLDGGKSAAWIDAKLPPERGRKDFTDYALVIGQPGVESRRIPLPIGNHRLIPTRPGTRLTLLTLPENMQDQTSTLHIVQNDDRIDSITLPFIVPPIYNDDSPWSPDGKYLYAAPRGASGYLFDATTGQTTMLKQKQPGMYIRWLDANTFKTCSYSNLTTETASIKIYETDARSGASHLVRFLPLKKDETPTVLAGLHYALVENELLDMETGRRFVLPMAEPLAAGEFYWQPRTERICYLANAAGQDSYRKPLFEAIVVFHPQQGIVAQLDFKTPQRIRWLRLAPDGQRLLFSHSARVPGVKPFMALTHTELWDMASDRRTRLFTHGMIPAILMDVLLMDQNVAEAPCWSPSGDGVVYPTMETVQFARKKMDVSFILARPE